MYSIILCGGSGTRLWPLSRKNFPKQFLKLYSDKSLLQETFLRMREIMPGENIYFVTNKLDEAMTSAIKINTIGFQTLAKDIIGDIYLKQGNKEEARKSYLEALKLYKGQGDIRKVIQNKIDSMGQ